MIRVCLTGGPGGGKSSCIRYVSRELKKRGYRCVFIEEGAARLIASGIAPGESLSVYDFQDLLLEVQIHDENTVGRFLEITGDKETVVLYDRGLADQRAYLSEEEYRTLLNKYGLTLEEVYGRYDLVCHLRTTAAGKARYYRWKGSHPEDEAVVRFESPEEARARDERTMQAWCGHPHFLAFENCDAFTEKAEAVLQEILKLAEGDKDLC